MDRKDVDHELRQGPQIKKRACQCLVFLCCFCCLPIFLLQMLWDWFWTKAFKYHWDVAFLVVCVVAAAGDPLFFYLPVINEATKCILIDKTLKIIAICVRSFLDFVALGDLVAMNKKNTCSHMQINNKWPQEGKKNNKCRHCMKRSGYVINILSILPVHQVLMPIIFSEMRGSKISQIVKFLNAIVVLQYVPRLIRIYRLWKIVNDTIILRPKVSHVKVNNAEINKKMIPKGLMVMQAGFNLLLYLVASHALGAFWYFFSFQREISCWQLACEHDIGCSKRTISLNCDSTHGFGNYMILNDFCSIKKPNTAFFDFGIFEDARQSGMLSSMDFPQKAMFCFWWGLRNLSSLGQNLETSPDFWENCFTVLISIFGLLLFLYFIGNLQVYMQWQTSKQLEIIIKQSEILQTKLKNMESWISGMELHDTFEEKIMSDVTPKLEDQNNHIDTENPFPHLNPVLQTWIKLYLCSSRLLRVPIFESASVKMLYQIASKHLKQERYDKNSFIVQQGKPLEKMIFVVKGHVCTCTSNDHANKEECPEKYDLIGEHDLNVQWVLESGRQSNPPISERTLKCHTKVEVFYLEAKDLKNIMARWKFIKLRDIIKSDSEQLRYFAALSIQTAWRYHCANLDASILSKINAYINKATVTKLAKATAAGNSPNNLDSSVV